MQCICMRCADGMISWRLWYLGVCWFLVETAIYGILFWTPLLLEALLTHNFDGTHPTTHTTNSKDLVSLLAFQGAVRQSRGCTHC